MSAKLELIERLKYLDKAVQLPAIIDNGVTTSEHNEVANLLRKGLSIVAFNILEDFVKNKSVEALNYISATSISFSNLTELLQESSITGALYSLNFHSSVLKKENPNYKQIIQEEARKIASTSNLTFELSRFSLMYSGYNISSKEVSDFMKSFGIDGGWNKLKNISDSIGGGIPDLSQAFNLASSRRNNAAHSAGFNYNYNWLENLKSEILAIAASLDISISGRCRQVKNSPNLKMHEHNLSLQLNYRFLEFDGMKYKETIRIGGKSIKNWENLQQAYDHHAERIIIKKEFLIVLNTSKRIVDWLT